MDNKTKIVVGRTHKDNENIKKYYDSVVDTLIKVKNIPGPIVLMPHGGSKEADSFIAKLGASFISFPDRIEEFRRNLQPECDRTVVDEADFHMRCEDTCGEFINFQAGHLCQVIK